MITNSQRKFSLCVGLPDSMSDYGLFLLFLPVNHRSKLWEKSNQPDTKVNKELRYIGQSKAEMMSKMSREIARQLLRPTSLRQLFTGHS